MESSTSLRFAAIVMGWALLMAAIVTLARLFSPSFAQVMIVVLIFLTLIGITLLGFTQNWGRVSNTDSQETSSEARKRNRLTMALHDLSDSELIRLRQRLASGDIDDDQFVRLMDERDASKAKRS